MFFETTGIVFFRQTTSGNRRHLFHQLKTFTEENKRRVVKLLIT